MTESERETRKRRLAAVAAALSEAFGLTEAESERGERYEVRVLKGREEAKGE